VNLYRHQIEASTFLSQRPSALYWADPGTGKTAAAVTACAVTGAKNILVLCPLSVVTFWRNEFWAWTRTPARVLRFADDAVRAAVVITNPDKLLNPPILKALLARSWDVIILDESQMFKNPEAKRTKHVFGKTGLVHRTRRVWLLSGTPIPQGPIDLYLQMKVLWPEILNGLSRDNFIEYYHVLSPDKTHIVGTRPDRMQDLQRRLAPHMLRHLEKDCLDLPPLRWGIVPLAKQDLELDSTALAHAMVAADADGWGMLSDDDLLQLVKDGRLHMAPSENCWPMRKPTPCSAWRWKN